MIQWKEEKAEQKRLQELKLQAEKTIGSGIRTLSHSPTYIMDEAVDLNGLYAVCS